MDKRDRIRELNDAFRTTFVGGKVMMTAGVAALPTNELAGVLSAVRARLAGIHISIWAYCRVGVPVALITPAAGAWWLA